MKNTLKEDLCIDQGPVPGNTPIMYPCHAYSPQVMQATDQIFTYELLVTVPFKPPQGHEIGASKLLSLCYLKGNINLYFIKFCSPMQLAAEQVPVEI